MATAVSATVLCAKPNVTFNASFVNTQSDFEYDKAIITTGNNCVGIFKVDDQKLLKTWSTKHTLNFTCPVVPDFLREQYVGVQNKTIIRCWSYEAENIDREKRWKLTEPVFCVLPIPNSEPVVVFQNGNCSFLNDILLAGKDYQTIGQLCSEEQLYWADACFSENVIILLLTWNEKVNTWVVYWLQLSSQHSTELLGKTTFHKKDHQLCTWCLSLGADIQRFLTLWSDGIIYSLEPKNDTLKKLFQVSDSEKTQSFMMTSLNDSYVAIAMKNLENITGEFVIEIWDINFCFQHTRLFVSYPMSCKGQMTFFNGNFYVPCEQGVVSVPYLNQPASLARAVGRLPSLSTSSFSSHSEMLHWKKTGVVSFQYKKDQQNDDILEQYFHSGGRSVSLLYQDLFKKICEKLDFAALSKLLKQVSDIPEKVLVDILNYLLSAGEEIFAGNDEKSTDCPLNDSRSSLIDLVLCYPYNEAFILPYLKVLHLNQIMLLIRYLHYLLKVAPYLETSDRSEVTVTKAAAWMVMIFTAKFEEILVCSDESSKQLIRSLIDTTKELQKSCKDTLMMGLITALKKRLEMPKGKKASSLYCIEVLCI
ncbi:nucleolar protein 11-like isoform X2 [Limulus polyphemus]|uniref:Nucleolar protein 11-like isoform X2 n=1 Tax=Limulus polyphemus TaxID=6850 RepID=A0ABM1T4K3_LIMPO|nr:nucleolar protein 11-like isoform X2 [Limulus polyphemus]